ncbi:MAG: protein kinase [Deltaproteobacteria bacterium]|nr:protein kinase [Deltaproteobacteria bacterium]
MGTTRTCSKCGEVIAGTLDHCPKDGTALFPDEIMARVGLLLKDHEIQGVIGEGGMGVVYRAQHVVIEKPVAIKVLHDRFARQKDMVEQFIIEAKAASRIRHPNIIDVTDFGTTPEGLVFLIMEYLDGESLEDRLRRIGRLPVFEAINIAKQVARALGAAHELGVVHRDLKPANIFLCLREGRRRIVRRTEDPAGAQFTIEAETSFDLVKLLDFGVAKFLDLGPSAATRAGALCGSPHYLSPEQAQEKPATERSDIYALGATLYEMVTGKVPFDGSSVLEILNGHVAGKVLPPSQRAPDAGLDARLDAVIGKCLEKDPAQRFASTDELCDALRECVTDRAFLRDAHRLPGIRDSGLDLSEATADARHVTPAAGASPRDPDEGFSVKEDDREHAELSDSGDVADGKRFPGDTMRIRGRSNRRSARSLGVVALLLAGAGAAVWALRGGAGPSTGVPPSAPPTQMATPTATSSRPPASVAPPPAAPVEAVKVLAPSEAAGTAVRPAHTPPLAEPQPAVPPAAGPGKTPDRGADKPAAGRARSVSSGGPHWQAPVVPPPPEPLPPPPPPPAPVPVAPAPPPTPPADVEALLREAQQAWTRQHYAVAIDKAREVLKADPRRRAAHQIIAVCSCAVGAAEDAREAASHLDEHKRKLVQTLCQRHGVNLE